MAIKQISVFLENKPAQLLNFSEILHANGIDMRALSVAETTEFGIARAIVNDADKAAEVLRAGGYVCSVTPVIAIEINDEVGGLYELLKMVGNIGVNIEYTYTFVARKEGSAYTVLRFDNNEKAAKALEAHRVILLTDADIEKM